MLYLGPIDAQKLGDAGVIAFFVHTSCVLMMSLDRLTREGGNWRDFYVRRAFRLYPLAIVTILLYLAFGIPSSPARPWFAISPKQIVANILLIHNLTLGPSVVSQLWTLPLEMQMYLVLPLLWWVANQRPAWLVRVCAAAVLIAAVQPAVSPRLSVLYFVPCFLSGVVAYYLLRKRKFSRHWSLFPLFLIAAYSIFSIGKFGFAGPWCLAASIGAAIPHFRDLPKGKLASICATVAKYSYGIYLAHNAAIWLCFHTQPMPLLVRWTGFIGLTALLSVAAYHLVEKPMIDIGVKLTSRYPATAPLKAKSAKAA